MLDRKLRGNLNTVGLGGKGELGGYMAYSFRSESYRGENIRLVILSKVQGTLLAREIPKNSR